MFFGGFFFVCVFVFADIQRERRELVTQIVTTTTRRPHSGPRGNPGPGRPNNKTRPSVQEDSEAFNPDNPYHVRTGVCATCSDKCINPNTEVVVFLVEASREHLVFN